MPRLEALLFDKDGTLVDFAKTWNAATVDVIAELAAGDAAAAERLAEVVHFDFETGTLLPSSPFVGASLADLAPPWAEAIGIAPDAAFLHRIEQLFKDGALRSVAPIGDPVGLFSGLKAEGYRLGIITNDTEASAIAQSEKLGFASFLDAVIGYDSGHGQKPEGGQILAFLSRFAIAPQATALVGDTLHDLHAARAAGVIAIGVASGYLTEEALRPHADHVVSDIMALPRLLEEFGED